jgi:hypothetical protein
MHFKDLRAFFLSVIFLILNSILFIQSIIRGEQSRTGVCLILFTVIFYSFLKQFYNRILDGWLFIYVFCGFALLPTMINFKDIEKVSKISKRKVTIISKGKKYNIYIFNSDKYLKALKNKEIEINEITK